MKKTTSKKLSKRLLKYGAFSAAILGTANANGQIEYTDIADITVNPANGRVAIDINNDATGDILFGVNSASNFGFVFPASSSMAPGYNSNLFVGFVSGPYAYPSNLAAGTVIDGTNPTFGNDRGDFNFQSCAYPGSQFCDGMDGYLGVHLDVGGNTHYGWVRIQVDASGAPIIIKDYAYNTTPDEAIEAGQQALSLDDFERNSTRIVALNKSIGLYELPNSTEFSVYDISGRVALSGTTSDTSYVIEANSLSTGVYIVELKSLSSSTVLRKKIVL